MNVDWKDLAAIVVVCGGAFSAIHWLMMKLFLSSMIDAAKKEFPSIVSFQLHEKSDISALGRMEMELQRINDKLYGVHRRRWDDPQRHNDD